MIRVGEALLGETMLRAQELNVTSSLDVLVWAALGICIPLLVLLLRRNR
jgi:hypothetical protein